MFASLPMKHKNLAAFCLIACVSLVVGAMTFQQTLEVDRATNEASKVRTLFERVGHLEAQLTKQTLTLKNFILTCNRHFLQSALETSANVDQAETAVVDAMNGADHKQEAKDVDRAMASYRRW